MTANALRPSSTPERHEAVDVLRGLGVFGILLINIQLFSMPYARSVNPTALGDRGALGSRFQGTSGVLA
jgi:uncharacterized protein